jgi:hypothetical protein
MFIGSIDIPKGGAWAESETVVKIRTTSWQNCFAETQNFNGILLIESIIAL